MKSRILHISDLQLGAALSVEALESLASITQDGGGFRPDYLAVCGNLTASGSPREFAQAADAIMRLLESLRVFRRQDSDLDRLNRLIIVPGLRDAQAGQEPLSRFQDFYKSLQERIAPSSPEGRWQDYCYESPRVMNLKDLTMICHPFLSIQRDRKESVSTFWSGILRQVATRNVDLEYCAASPVVLISGASLLLEPRLRKTIYSRKLEGIWKDTGVDIHLSGATSVACLTSEPFLATHVSLSTGPSAKPGLWPQRANVIEIQRAGRPGAMRRRLSDSTSRINVRSFRRLGHASEWQSESVLSKSVREEQRLPLSHARFFHDLEETFASLREPTLAVAEWFPGTGFRTLLSELRKVSRSAVAQWHLERNQSLFEVEFLEPSRDKDPHEALASALANLESRSHALSARADEVAEPSGVVCVALVDNCFSRILAKEADGLRSDPAQRWLDALRHHDVCRSGGTRFLWVLPASVDPALYGELANGQRRPLVLAPLGDACFERLVRYHLPEIPVDAALLEKLSGRHFGLALQLLGEQKRVFQSFSGARALEAQSGWEVMNAALAEDGFVGAFWSLEKSLREELGVSAQPLLEELAARFRERLAAKDLGPLPFSQEHTGLERHDYHSLRRLLTRHGILGPSDEPLLVALAPLAGAASLGRSRHPVDIAFSYRLEDKEVVHAVREILGERLSGVGLEATIEMFTGEEQPQEAAMSLALEHFVRHSHLLVFCGPDLGAYQHLEIVHYYERHHKEIHEGRRTFQFIQMAAQMPDVPQLKVATTIRVPLTELSFDEGTARIAERAYENVLRCHERSISAPSLKVFR